MRFVRIAMRAVLVVVVKTVPEIGLCGGENVVVDGVAVAGLDGFCDCGFIVEDL